MHYANNNLLAPFVEDLSRTDLAGSTCVLTQTNDEALQVTGMLLERGMPASLIQTNDGFDLYDLVELRYFFKEVSLAANTPVIDNEVWERAEKALLKQYGKSSLITVCKKIIRDFAAIYPKTKYRTDFEMFIKESKLEDFYAESRETILVSTIHKAKGREFDNVFLLLENFQPDTEEKNVSFMWL